MANVKSKEEHEKGGEVEMMRAHSVPYGVRHASTANSDLVDLSMLTYDPERQISYVRDGSTIVPALKHSTGKTRTSTASSDARPGNDFDDDYTED